MYIQIFLAFMVIKLTSASRPVVFLNDNTVIASNRVKESLPQHHQFIPSHYPYYEVITRQEAIRNATQPESSDLPRDLIEIARTKLGIQNIEEIPSVSELGELLGTTSREETLKLLRHLAATDSGIDLIKAFMESSDYTDSTENKEPVQIEADTSGPVLPTSLISETNQKNIEIIQKVLTTPRPELGFFQRVSSYINVFDLFPTNREIPYSPLNKEVQELNHENRHHDSNHPRNPKHRPISVTNNVSHSVSSIPGNVKLSPPARSTFNNRVEKSRRLDHWAHNLD